jgi:hypothetical protein
MLGAGLDCYGWNLPYAPLTVFGIANLRAATPNTFTKMPSSNIVYIRLGAWGWIPGIPFAAFASETLGSEKFDSERMFKIAQPGRKRLGYLESAESADETTQPFRPAYPIVAC